METKTRHQMAREALEAFADTLEAHGFRVYRPGGTWTFIGFARLVDGTWCSGTVQAGEFGGRWEWHMSIVPSRAWGSSMFLDDVPPTDDLTVESAIAVTRPFARNSVVPTRKNAGLPGHWTVKA